MKCLNCLPKTKSIFRERNAIHIDHSKFIVSNQIGTCPPIISNTVYAVLRENQSTGYGHLACSATQTSYIIETVHLHVTNNKGAATRSLFSTFVVRIFISSNDDGQQSCGLRHAF